MRAGSERAISDTIPYAPDFTPKLLGGQIGEDQVLEWLLRTVEATRSRSQLTEEIAARGFSHIKGLSNRLYMARHVVLGLRSYGLMEIDPDSETIALTAVGERIFAQRRPMHFGRSTGCRPRELKPGS